MRRGAIRSILLAAAWLVGFGPVATAQDPPPAASPEQLARWAGDLESGDARVRSLAWDGLRNAGPEAVPVLEEVARKGADRVAGDACFILGYKGDAAVSAIPAIEEVLNSRSPGTGALAVRALWRLRAKPEKCMERLRKFAAAGEPCSTTLIWRMTGEEGGLRQALRGLLASAQADERILGLEILEEFGPAAGKDFALGLAEPLAADPDRWVRGNVLRVRIAVDFKGAKSRPAFLLGLKDPEHLVRWTAARGLGLAGVEQAGTAESLGRAMLPEGGEFRRAVISGLKSAFETRVDFDRALAAILEKGSPGDRTGAALLAGWSPSAPRGRAEALAAGILDADPAFRSLCATDLRMMGADAAPAAPAVARAMRHEDDGVSTLAAETLGSLDAAGTGAAKELVACFADGRTRVRDVALDLLWRQGPKAGDALRASMEDPANAASPECALLLATLEPTRLQGDPRHLEAVREGLRSSRYSLQGAAVRCLRAGGPLAAAAVLPEIQAALRSSRLVTRREAESILVSMGAAAAPLVEKGLAAADPGDVLAACRVLSAMRKQGVSAAPALRRILGSDRADVRRAAAEALYHVAPEDPSTAGSLAGLLQDPDVANRALVARLLEILRVPATADALEAALRADPETRWAASRALARLGGAGLERLRGLCSDVDPDVRRWAVRGLGEMGASARDAAADLEKALGDADAEVRREAGYALRAVAPKDGAPEPSAAARDGDVDALLRKGRALEEAKKIEEALHAYEEAARLDPGSRDAWYAVGLLHHGGKRWEPALAAYARALRCDRAHAPSLYNSGLCLNELERYEEALRFLREAEEARPAHTGTMISLGFCLYQLKRFDESIDASRRAASLDPKDADPHFRIGRCLLELGRLTEAASSFRETARLAPRFATAHRYLAISLRKAGQNAEAVEAAREAVKLRPKEAISRATLILCLRSAGRKDEAAAELEALRALSPEEAKKLE